MNTYELSTVKFTLDTERPYVLTISASYATYVVESFKIGHFNFLDQYGYITMLDGTRKEVKRFNAIIDYFFKQDEFFGWNSNLVEQAKQNAKEAKQQEKKEAALEAQQLQVERANDLISKIESKDQSTVDCLIKLKDKEENEIIQLIHNTFIKLPAEDVTRVLIAIQSLFVSDNEKSEETFHLYNNTFNSYNEAYNYALNNDIPVTMILSNNHPTITNERLMQLEKEYTFSKRSMNITDMKEYYNYISGCPLSLDKDNRYYKLKGWIESYENKQQRIKQSEQDQYNLALKDKETMEYMRSKGLEVIFSDYMQKYMFKGECIHTWIGGSLSAEEYHNMVQGMYNSYFKEAN